MNILCNTHKLIEKYNIKPRDAIHASTALLYGKDIISDEDFDVIKELNRLSIDEFRDI